MQDVLIPLGMLIFIGLMAFAMIHTGRKQRAAKSDIFRDFAKKNALRYRPKDDGTAQSFARDFEGIGRFRSPSLGAVVPQDVVSGNVDSLPVLLFRHFTRFGEGWAMEWFVAAVTVTEAIALRCSLQFCQGRGDKSTMYLGDPVVKEHRAGQFELVVRGPSTTSVGNLLDERVLDKLARLAAGLAFRPEIQVRDTRIAAYLADRNATLEDAVSLESLFEFVRSAADAMRSPLA